MSKKKRKDRAHCEEIECCEKFQCCEEKKPCKKKCHCKIDECCDEEDFCCEPEPCKRKSVSCALPANIRELLCLLAEDDCDENSATLVLDTCCECECVLEDVEIVAVFDDTVIVRCNDEFSYINICCICVVKVDCDDILDELLESCSKDCCSKNK